MIELLKRINRHLEFLMDCTIEPSDVRVSTPKLIDEIKSITDKPISNADRIRQMTDEELADFLLESRSRCKLCKKRDEICEGAYHECWNGIDDWLKQEEKDDAET